MLFAPYAFFCLKSRDHRLINTHMETICKEDQSVLPTNNATDGVFFYTSPLTQQPAKTDVVRWLKETFRFGHLHNDTTDTPVSDG